MEKEYNIPGEIQGDEFHFNMDDEFSSDYSFINPKTNDKEKKKKWIQMLMIPACVLLVVMSKATVRTDEMRINEEVTENPVITPAVEEEVVSEKEEEKIFSEGFTAALGGSAWGKKSGIEFYNERTFTLPMMCFALTEDNEIITSFEYPQTECDYKISNISVSDPDEEGNREVLVRVSYSGTWIANTTAESVAEVEQTYYHAYKFNSVLGVVDYYTGTVFPSDNLIKRSQYNSNTVIRWNEIDYPMSFQLFRNSTFGGRKYEQGEKGLDISIPVNGTYTYKFVIPQEYDGLVLYVPKGGSHDLAEEEAQALLMEEDTTETTLTEAKMWSDEDDVSDYYFISVADLISKYAK